MKNHSTFLVILIVFSSCYFAFAEFTAEQILGIGYEPGHLLAPVFVERGITSVKAIAHVWETDEPEPPDSFGVHTYIWDEIDSIIIRHQRNGITEFCLWLGCKCDWATCPHWAPVTTKDRRSPLPEHEDDFYDWVYNLVERFDCDGVADAPGLLYPVLLYMLESEAQQYYFFEGCSRETHLQDYLDNLAIAHDAIKDACSDAQVGLSAALFMDMFDDFPGDSVLLERVAFLDSVGTELGDTNMGTREMNFITQTLAADSLYDFACIHPLTNWQGLFGMVGFIRDVFDSLGIEKMLVADDIVSGPMYYADSFVPHLPDICDSLYHAIGEGTDVFHDSIDAWFRANQARSVAKNYVVGLGLGLQRMWIETTIDWLHFTWTAPHWAYIGLVDYNLLLPALSVPRPALHTMKLLDEKFAGYRTIERCPPFDDPARIYLYRFSDGYRTDMLCIWFEDHLDELPEDLIGDTTDIELAGFFPAEHRVLRTRIVTSRLDSLPQVDTLLTDAAGILILPTLDKTPVFLEDIGAVTIAEDVPLPKDWEVSVYPNPFNSACIISVETQNLASLPTTIEIFDLRGNLVEATPCDRPDDMNEIIEGHPHGDASTSRTFTWCPDETISSGVYLIRAMTNDGQKITKKTAYLK